MKKPSIKAFIGIANDIFVVTITSSDGIGTYQLEPVKTKTKDIHTITLLAIKRTLQEFKNISLNFYANNDIVSFEWETEYKKDKFFSNKTKDIDKWNEIIKLVQKNNVELFIKGEDSILSGAHKLYGRI